MGKKKKEHRKKVAKRNEKIASQKKKLQKMYLEELVKQMKKTETSNFIPSKEAQDVEPEDVDDNKNEDDE
jgi:ribosomal protein L1